MPQSDPDGIAQEILRALCNSADYRDHLPFKGIHKELMRRFRLPYEKVAGVITGLEQGGYIRRTDSILGLIEGREPPPSAVRITTSIVITPLGKQAARLAEQTEAQKKRLNNAMGIVGDPVTPDTPIQHEPEDPTVDWAARLAAVTQGRSGARWVPDGTVLRVEPTGALSDEEVASEALTRQLHDGVKKKATVFAEAAVRLDNLIGWGGASEAASRFFEEISVETCDIPRNLGNLYDAALSLFSYLDQDDRLQGDHVSDATPLAPELRRKLVDLARSSAPFLRRFPTVCELDDAAGMFLVKQNSFEHAKSFVASAKRTNVIVGRDAELVMSVLDAAGRGGFQSTKAGYRGTHTCRNLLYAVAGVVATFYSGAVASDFATRSELVQRAGRMLEVAESEIRDIVAYMPDDLRIAMHAMLREITENKDLAGTDP